MERGLVLEETPYNVQTDQSKYHEKYDAFVSNDVNIMIKFFGDVMKPGAQWYVFCAAL